MSSTSSIIVIASLVLIANAAVGGISVFGTARRPTLKIGVSLPLSGPSYVHGRETLQDLVRVVNELNAVSGTSARGPAKIKLLVFDDQDNPASANQVAGELIRRDVIAVIGHSSSLLSDSVILIYETNGVPHFSFGSGSGMSRISGSICSTTLPCDAVRTIIETVRDTSRIDVKELRLKLRSFCCQGNDRPSDEAPKISSRNASAR